ncbi:hypothetical protein ACOME3_000044 [Neoechinorhynchus agilis]
MDPGSISATILVRSRIPNDKKGNVCNLHHLFKEILEKQVTPRAFTRSIVVPLAKKGSRFECFNHRGISLPDVHGKILCYVILNIPVEAFDGILRPQQDGLGPGSSPGLRNEERHVELTWDLTFSNGTAHGFRLCRRYCSLSTCFNDLQEQLDDLNSCGSKVGRRDDERVPVLNDAELEVVPSFVYLGLLVPDTGSSAQDIRRRTALAAASFNALNNV